MIIHANRTPVMTDDHWFTPKTHGYGATPANWKGWAATLGFGLLTLGLGLIPSLLPDLLSTPDWPYKIAVWLAAILVAILGFVRLARVKTAGEWRWRWGDGRTRR